MIIYCAYYQLTYFVMITTAIILLVVWLLATMMGLTMGGYLHILLGVVIVLILYRLIKGGKATEHTKFQ